MMSDQEQQEIREIPDDQDLRVSENDSSFLEYVDLVKRLADPHPLKSDDLGDRKFLLLGGKICIGILLAENSDSFYVAHLSYVDEGKVLKRLTQGSVMRLVKSSCIGVELPSYRERIVFLKSILNDSDHVRAVFGEDKIQAAYRLVSVDNSPPTKSDRTYNEKPKEAGGHFPPYTSKVKH